jgi:hypothetical protein
MNKEFITQQINNTYDNIIYTDNDNIENNIETNEINRNNNKYNTSIINLLNSLNDQLSN